MTDLSAPSDTTLVIFDCDGVLADSEVISAGILIDLLRPFGLHLTPQYVYRNFVGKSFPGVVEIIRTNLGCALPHDFEDQYRSALTLAFKDCLRPTPGLHAMLDRLGCPACVATSSSPRRVALTLRKLGLSARFGAQVFTASQVARGKPAPDLFLHAAREMDTPPERCLVIEDSRAGIIAARAAGMPVWRYVGAAHFTGIDAARAETPTDVPVFDNWAHFYLMHPGLERSRTAHGQTDPRGHTA